MDPTLSQIDGNEQYKSMRQSTEQGNWSNNLQTTSVIKDKLNKQNWIV